MQLGPVRVDGRLVQGQPRGAHVTRDDRVQPAEQLPGAGRLERVGWFICRAFVPREQALQVELAHVPVEHQPVHGACEPVLRIEPVGVRAIARRLEGVAVLVEYLHQIRMIRQEDPRSLHLVARQDVAGRRRVPAEMEEPERPAFDLVSLAGPHDLGARAGSSKRR